MNGLFDKNEMKDIYELWRACFFDTKEYTDFYFRYKVPVNEISTIYEDNELISMLHLNPYRIQLRQREILSKYIVGVATKKEYRKKGFMKDILTKALNDMWKEKVEFAYLMPAAEKIYYPYSFRYVYTQHRAKMIINKDDQLEEKIDAYQEVDMLTTIPIDGSNHEKAYQDLAELSNALLEQHFDCFTIRDQAYFEEIHEEMISTDGNIVLLYQGMELVGYFSFMVNGDEAEVVESVVIPHFKDIAIKTIFLYFYDYLQNKNRNKKQEEIISDKLAVSFLETYFLKDIERIINDVTISKTPIIMARIIHFEEFMKHMKAKKDISIIIRVIDHDIKANEGVYELSFQDGNCSVKRTKKKEEVCLEIADITRMAFGCLELKDGITIQAVSDDIKNRLRTLVPYKKLYINEIV